MIFDQFVTNLMDKIWFQNNFLSIPWFKNLIMYFFAEINQHLIYFQLIFILFIQ